MKLRQNFHTILSPLNRVVLKTRSDDKILDIHSLSNGIYYLSIEFESGKIERKKIIKL